MDAGGITVKIGFFSGLKEFARMNRRGLIVGTHLALISVAYLGAYFLRFEFCPSPDMVLIALKTLPFLLIIKVFLFHRCGLFVGLWRYVSVEDIWQILKANLFSTILFVFFVVFVFGLSGFPRSVFVLDWGLCIGMMTSIRLVARMVRAKIRPMKQIQKRTLVIGAGQAGVSVVRESRQNPDMNLDIVGFIDDDPAKMNSTVYGVKILGTRKDIPALAEKLGVQQILIAIPSAKGEVIRDILAYCELPGIGVKTLPRLDQFFTGDLQIRPREVRPEDLLGREAVGLNFEEIRDTIKGRTVLVTGAGGSIGSELCRQIARFSPEKIILFDHNENEVYFLVVQFQVKFPHVQFQTVIGDIRDVGLLRRVFTRYNPSVVFHAAAHKHVPLMEENPSAAVKNNILGSRNLIYASSHYGVERFVLISTDKAVNPSSVMGMSKRIAEMILQAKASKSRTKFMAVRFGNVLGSAGSVVPLFKRQIEEGGPITVTHPEACRYFMSISEAASLVLQAAAIGKGGEVFVLDMGEPIKILDIAKNLVSFSGLRLDKDISIEFTGLRPGEKLVEDLLLNVEKDGVTRHEKIFITKPGRIGHLKLRFQVKDLDRLARIMAEDEIVSKMKEMVGSPAQTPGKSN